MKNKEEIKSSVILRRLEVRDAPCMLEWMRDSDFQKAFHRCMGSITLEEAEQFCKNASNTELLVNNSNLHLAISNDISEYLGTISLKNIDLHNRSAEFAIVVKKAAWGQGVAKSATKLVLEKAFTEYGLHRVYLNVLKENKKAIELYKKCGFMYEGEARDYFYVQDHYRSVLWFSMLDSEYRSLYQVDSAEILY